MIKGSFTGPDGCDASPAPIVRPYAFTRSDLILTSSDWSTLLVAVLSRDVQVRRTQFKFS